MNPWAWNMNANMIYLEAPVGVGFSKGSADDMKLISDATTAFDNNEALKVEKSLFTLPGPFSMELSINVHEFQVFFTDKFPQYLANGIFVSGESYAGIYVPTLIANIVDDDLLQPHFKGAYAFTRMYHSDKYISHIHTFIRKLIYYDYIIKYGWPSLGIRVCS